MKPAQSKGLDSNRPVLSAGGALRVSAAPPKFTIVTVSLNQQQFLRRAIDSVLRQDYPNLQYIVVDGGSADGSVEVIQEYANHLAEIICEPDKGPAEALNKGFALASGDLLGFLNSDDELLPGALNKVASYSAARPDVDVMSGHAVVIDAVDRELRKVYSDVFDLRAFAYKSVLLIQPSTFFRRGAFARAGGFDESLAATWDAALWMKMALGGSRFGLLDELLSCYRLHEASITFTQRLREASLAESRQRFRCIMGRDWRRSDTVLSGLFRLRKYWRDPRSLHERLLYGSVARPRLWKSNA